MKKTTMIKIMLIISCILMFFILARNAIDFSEYLPNLGEYIEELGNPSF